MARNLAQHIAREFPEYLDLHDILSLAAKTWPRFGISARDLAQAEEYEQELIKIYLDIAQER